MAIEKCLGAILPSDGCLEAVDALSKERGEAVEFCKLSMRKCQTCQVHVLSY
jgi:hypothetical protein